MSIVFASLFILLLLACWLLNLVNLPGNWLNVLFIITWGWIMPQVDLAWSFLLFIVCTALLAEGIEFGTQLLGGRKYGATSRGHWGSILGTFLGALLGAPILFGLGAIFGALLGAFAGSLLLELLSGRYWREAVYAAQGALWGRTIGFSAKIGLGFFLIVISVPRIWP